LGRDSRLSALIATATALTLLAWALFATLIAPGLIRSAYRGESLPALNRLITGQAANPVEAYIREWSTRARQGGVAILLGGLAALVLARSSVRRWIASRALVRADGVGEIDAGRAPPIGRRLALILALAVASVFIVQPDLLDGFARGIWGARHDGAHNLWLLAWGHHALTTDPRGLFDANIFHPARLTFALSELRLGDQIFFAPAYALSASPIVAYNVVMTAQLALTAVTTALLAWHLFGSWGGAALAGAMFALSPTRLAHLDQSQLLSACWTPLAVLFLDRFLDSRAWRDALGCGLCVALQCLASFYLGYFLVLVMAVWIATRVLSRPRDVFRAATLGRGLVAAGLAAVLVVPLALPYLQVRAEYGALDPPSDFLERASAEGLVSYRAARPASLLYGRLLAPSQSGLPWEKWLFPGFLAIGLAVLGLVVVSRRPGLTRRRVWGVWGLAAVAFLLSLGPTIHVVGMGLPSPYRALLAVWPGFGAMRVPARLGILVAFALALAAAAGFAWLVRRMTPPARAVAFVLCFGLVLAESAGSSQLVALPKPAEIAEEHRWLAENGVGALLEMPIRIPPSSAAPALADRFEDLRRETGYMYASIYHWRPLVNGYSSHRPRTVADVIERVQALPSEESFRYLRAIGVRQILAHRDQPLARWIGTVPPGGDAGSVQRFSTGSILLTMPDLRPGRDVDVRVAAPTQWQAGTRDLRVVFTNPDPGAYWVNEGQRACRLALHWRGPGGESRGSAKLRVLPPVALAPGEMRERRVPVQVPPGAGPVRLASVLTCGDGASTLSWSAEASVALAREVPIAESAEAVGATHDRSWAPATVCAACPLLFRLHTKNTGATPWPGRGNIRLAASWTDETGRRVGEATVALEADVYPGEETVLAGVIPSPPSPGACLLGLDLVLGRAGARAAAAPHAVTVTAR
jgi:hypothetical protein